MKIIVRGEGKEVFEYESEKIPVNGDVIDDQTVVQVNGTVSSKTSSNMEFEVITMKGVIN